MAVKRVIFFRILLMLTVWRLTWSFQTCPQGFTSWNGMCVQQASSCPPPYQLVQGICLLYSQTQNSNANAQNPFQPTQPWMGTLYPTQPVHLYPTPQCPSQPAATNSIQIACQTPCVAPQCPNQPVQPCCAPQYPTQPPGPCIPVPCPIQPPPQPTQPPYVPPPVTTLPEKATTTTTTTSRPPPAEIQLCPAGTIMVEGACRLIYCGKGIFRDNKCIETQCPAGTAWTGVKCAVPEPIVHNVAYNHTVITHFNHTENVIINNNNDVMIQITMATPTIEEVTLVPPLCQDVQDDGLEESDCQRPSTNEKRKCCTVLTPRICENSKHGAWKCYRRRYMRCGEFCIAPTIQLIPPRAIQKQHLLAMPPQPSPEFENCRLNGNCSQPTDTYDCSGCVYGISNNCSPYCYSYNCPKHRCYYYDQQKFCTQFHGESGCYEQDACFDEWCS